MENYYEKVKKSDHCKYVLFISFYLHGIASESQLEEYRNRSERVDRGLTRETY